jgi:hypothetical protein
MIDIELSLKVAAVILIVLFAIYLFGNHKAGLVSSSVFQYADRLNVTGENGITNGTPIFESSTGTIKQYIVPGWGPAFWDTMTTQNIWSANLAGPAGQEVICTLPRETGIYYAYFGGAQAIYGSSNINGKPKVDTIWEYDAMKDGGGSLNMKQTDSDNVIHATYRSGQKGPVTFSVKKLIGAPVGQ